MGRTDSTKTWASAWLKKFGQAAVCHEEKSLYKNMIRVPFALVWWKFSTAVIPQECWSFRLAAKTELA